MLFFLVSVVESLRDKIRNRGKARREKELFLAADALAVRAAGARKDDFRG